MTIFRVSSAISNKLYNYKYLGSSKLILAEYKCNVKVVNNKCYVFVTTYTTNAKNTMLAFMKNNQFGMVKIV